MGWAQRHAEMLANQKYQEEQRLKEEQRKRDLAAAQQAAKEKRNNQWQKVYNEGGDQALADWMIENQTNGEVGLTKQDLAYANQIKKGTSTSFYDIGKQAQADHHQQWSQMTAGNDTYGAQNQTLRQLMPYKRLENQYEGLQGWVDPQIQIDKDNAAAKAAEEQERQAAASEANKKRQEEINNSETQKNQSVNDAFYGSNNVIGNGPNSNREEAVERAQEYQNNSNNQTVTNADTSKAINNTEKSTTTKTTTYGGSGYVQGLADKAFGKYQGRWSGGGGNQTTDYSSIFNNVKQNVGNMGDWKTNVGSNNKISTSRIGNKYSLNLGNINLNNQQS